MELTKAGAAGELAKESKYRGCQAIIMDLIEVGWQRARYPILGSILPCQTVSAPNGGDL